jgi:hypothetical protein
MDLYDTVYKMNTLFGIWHYNDRIRVTYVSQGWLVVWDHKQTPPRRYDCQNKDHHEACTTAINKLREIAIS